MPRYVLKFRGNSPRQADVDLIERSVGVTVLDRTAGTLLIDAPERAAQGLRRQLPDWSVAPETTYPPPEPFTQRIRDDDSPRRR